MLQQLRFLALPTIISTPTLDTAQFGSGELMLATLTPLAELANVFQMGGALLQSLVVKDVSGQSGAFDVVLFKAATLPASTLTTNAAINIADADLPMYCGTVHIVANDYDTAWAANSVATKTGINLVLNPDPTTANSSVWYLLVSRDTKTYAAAGLTLEFGFVRD